jgi:predicted N-formylglutamate amidohydrolase
VRERLHAKQDVVHVSVHSFTPELDGDVRNADIGLLYDPKRKHEKAFCERWRTELLRRAPGLRVRMNYPYTGTSDGFTTALRRIFPKGYCGIELEVNQRFAKGKRMHADIRTLVYASLEATLRA